MARHLAEATGHTLILEKARQILTRHQAIEDLPLIRETAMVGTDIGFPVITLEPETAA